MEGTEAALTVLGLLWVAFTTLTGVVFGMLIKRQHNDSLRITQLEITIGELRVGQADGKRDRQGLHERIGAGFAYLSERQDLMSDAIKDERIHILRLIDGMK